MMPLRRPPFATDPNEPLRQGPYQSPLRDERVAALLGVALGLLFGICFATGLYSHIQQHPLRWLPVPAAPAGLYRITQGVHVAAGTASLPVLLAKLWVVWPRFVAWPPVKSLAHLVERVGLLPLVGGGVFMIFSGVANIAQWYPWRFAFPAAHYWVAWVTMGALLAHVGAKWAIARRALAMRSRRPPLAEADPALGTSAEGRLALLAPRDPDVGPQGRPVNRSAANAGVIESARSPDYRLRVDGQVAHPLALTVDELEAMAVNHSTLPIACVEGWSYSATWRGVRLVDLLRLAGARPGASVRVESLEADSPYRASFIDSGQAHSGNTLLATHLDRQRLDLDHGYPLRLIGPDRPGVNQTKWVTRVVVL